MTRKATTEMTNAICYPYLILYLDIPTDAANDLGIKRLHLEDSKVFELYMKGYRAASVLPLMVFMFMVYLGLDIWFGIRMSADGAILGLIIVYTLDYVFSVYKLKKVETWKASSN